MSHVSERPARVERRADRAGTAHSRTIAHAVAPEVLHRASEVADAYLAKLTLAADTASKAVHR
ncbi:hypothetical protein [Streptomyces marianii]|uniref:Uncharacterized protein n=1 Tax=Streptomyces marianii TaxID=1817406 RepID=A0A5R9DU65_9ACTN|nr:hypothetical protein [Streptomyces marianii]TLQ39304.1 hypothetical protein FEF34_38585 [Streptomyces marianii]